ncbi:MAG: rhodanese-like domain-containing protein [Clostridiales bacterium]|nr:rhodanese-like domain-containing protein [Clostridiales bacterium]
MKKPFLIGLACILTAASLSACSGAATVAQEAPTAGQSAALYHKISASEAKAVIDTGENVIILDVREQSEYDSGHIPGAMLLPLGSITARAAEVLPDTDQKILVYCRSGNRSRTAANMLVDLGYTQIYDFGGIIDWPYDVEKANAD